MTTDISHQFELSDASEFLVRRGAIAFARLDEDLIVCWRSGHLADWLAIGANVCTNTLPFAGLGTKLRALQDDPEASLLIPNIGLGQNGDPDLKISIQTFWDEMTETFLVVIYELGPQAESDRDLFMQLKARRLAEDNFRKAREQLKEKRHRLELLMEHAPAAIAMMDRDLRYQFVTRRWAQVFGLEFEPLLGRRHTEAFPTQGGAKEERYQNCLDGVAIRSEIEKMQQPDGTMQWVRWDHQPWHRPDGSVGGIISSADILTELIATQRQQEARNAELASLNNDLEEFASIITHDLGAPIRLLQQEAEKLKTETQADSATASTAMTIIATITRIQAMLADLYDYSRAGGKSHILREIDLKQLIGEIQTAIPEAAQFTIEFVGASRTVDLPIAPIDLVLRNLIDNAVKHHDRQAGHIQIRLGEDEAAWWFSASDDGPGICRPCQDKIFRPFEKGQTVCNRPGSGMGLAIVKKTIEAHGGTIRVVSDPECVRGTTFVFSWPKPEQDESPSTASPTS